MLKLQEVEVEPGLDRPLEPHKILSAEVIYIEIKLNKNFFIAHISIPRLLTALGVYTYIQMYEAVPADD
jgi:hypothetical protein